MTSTPRHPSLADIIEHAMRVCAEDAEVIGLFDTDTSSVAAAAAVGRLVHVAPHAAGRIGAGTPLFAHVTGTTTNPDWREQITPVSGSLFTQLEFLRTLYGAATSAPAPTEAASAGYATAYDEYLALSATADADLAQA